MSLEELRNKAIYQNTVDTWISLCLEKNISWCETDYYKKFIRYILGSSIKLQKFPLCIKESGGEYKRGIDKTKFVELLSKSNEPESMAYTIKLNNQNIDHIRKFQL